MRSQSARSSKFHERGCVNGTAIRVCTHLFSERTYYIKIENTRIHMPATASLLSARIGRGGGGSLISLTSTRGALLRQRVAKSVLGILRAIVKEDLLALREVAPRKDPNVLIAARGEDLRRRGRLPRVVDEARSIALSRRVDDLHVIEIE